MAVLTVLPSIVMLLAVVPAWTEKHSLYYIYTALSKPVNLPGIYEFTAMGLLDDRQIDYYNSMEQQKIPKQNWMKEKMQADYWDKGTQSRKSKEQWFNVNVKILMDRMRHNNSDVHVLQWRHGCEIESQGKELRFSKGIDEYSYDGNNFLSFDDAESQWVAPVDAAVPTKKKWDNVAILNQYTKGYLEKECVDWLNKFREYGDEELKQGSPPEVHVFAKRINNGKAKLKLTCLATGFYPKDVFLAIRKYRVELPDKAVESSGIRPNEDGTFQLRKSAYIFEDEKAEYDCYVAHKTLQKSITKKWDGTVQEDSESWALICIIVGAILVVVVLAAIGGSVFFLKKRNGNNNGMRSVETNCSGNKSEKSPMMPTVVCNSAVPGNKSEKSPMMPTVVCNSAVPGNMGKEIPGSGDSGKGSSDGSSNDICTQLQEQRISVAMKN